MVTITCVNFLFVLEIFKISTSAPNGRMPVRSRKEVPERGTGATQGDLAVRTVAHRKKVEEGFMRRIVARSESRIRNVSLEVKPDLRIRVVLVGVVNNAGIGVGMERARLRTKALFSTLVFTRMTQDSRRSSRRCEPIILLTSSSTCLKFSWKNQIAMLPA